MVKRVECCVKEKMKFIALSFVNINIVKTIILDCHDIAQYTNPLKSCVLLFNRSYFIVLYTFVQLPNKVYIARLTLKKKSQHNRKVLQNNRNLVEV